ncbi:MAG: hypothetical protein LBC74_11830 [Planctomycetaceae bacterium]|jgi:hypothetical protein|nr:hypothetical protein [Planctomycetaceae bacterium]
MSILDNAKIELLDRLENNPLQDADDLTAYIQYACRLASLGDQSKIDELPSLLTKKQFVGKISDIIKERCEQGWFEMANYPSEDLAISLIDAQDFYLFEQRFGKDYPDLKPYFTKWFQDAEEVEIDDECAEFLEAFLAKFPIPEEERLPVINTPITEREYALLEFAYRNVKLPVYNCTWKINNNYTVNARRLVYNPQAKTKIEFPIFQAADDSGKLHRQQKEFLDSPNNEFKTPQGGTLYISRTVLNDYGDLRIRIQDENDNSPAVNRVRLGHIPAIRDDNQPTDWIIKLKHLPNKIHLLKELPIVIRFTQGYDVIFE